MCVSVCVCVCNVEKVLNPVLNLLFSPVVIDAKSLDCT